MAVINLNDVTPAPPARLVNVKFQSDASGNVSAYSPGGTWDETYVPVVTPLAPMTLPTLSSSVSSFARNGSLCTITTTIVGVFGGTPSNRVDVSLPTTTPMVGNRSFTSAAFITQAAQQVGFASISFNTPAVIQVQLPGLVNFTANNFSMLLTISYRCA